MVLDPLAQAAGDGGEHGVVDGRVGQPPGGVVERSQRRAREGHLALVPDLPVERRRPGRELHLVAHERGEAHVPVGVVSGRRRPASHGRVAVVVPEHRVREAHRHGPVGERVVHAPDESGPPARACDHVEVPERPRSIQPLGEQARDLGPQRAVVAGIDVRRGHVCPDVEAIVVDPDRLPRGSRSRRVRAGTAGSRRSIAVASRSALGAPGPISTTLQVCPATLPVSSAKIARSSSVRAMPSMYPPLKQSMGAADKRKDA